MISENKIKEILGEILEVNSEDVPEDASFVRDLGLDSLRALEILAAIEQNYNIVIPPERLADMDSVQGVIAVTKEIYEESKS